jgi:hypothetical protein
MRRSFLVPDASAANVDNPNGIQSLIRVFPPPETSAFTSVSQVAPKADIDESLQGTKRLTGISMGKIVRPSF